MPVLAKKWFQETGDMSHDLAKKVEVASFGLPISQTLIRLGWDGSLVAGIGLELTPDNRHIVRGEFFMRGDFTKEPTVIKAKNLWPNVSEDISLSVTIPDASHFRHNSGTLSRDLLGNEEYYFNFTKGGITLNPSDWDSNGVGETCMRAISHLDKGSNGKSGPTVKTTILLFPRSVDALNQLSDSTQSPAWPGFRILETNCRFFPNAAEWKDPCCPLILRGSHHSEAPNLPPGREIQILIAATMRSAKRPTCCTNLGGLTKQWNNALEDIEQMEHEPIITWPEVTGLEPEKGKIQS